VGVHIDTTEVRKLAVDLHRAGARVGAKSAQVIRKTARDIEGDSKTLCPVDTGNLKNSISVDFEGDGRFGAMSAEIGPTADYGHYVEDGTSRMSPQPYMGPAFDRRAPIMQTALGKVVEDIL